MKHFFVAFAIFFSLTLSLFSFNTVNAGITSTFTNKVNKLTKPFGGQVYLTKIPGVVCKGIGQLVVSSANTSGAISAVKGATSSQVNPTQILSGLHNMIPTYTTDFEKRAKVLGYILGRENLVPDLTTCSIGNIPFPVLRTTMYGVSTRVTTERTSIVDGMPVTNSFTSTVIK